MGLPAGAVGWLATAGVAVAVEAARLAATVGTVAATVGTGVAGVLEQPAATAVRAKPTRRDRGIRTRGRVDRCIG
jgi:hypothetical protein